jgi:hypothetical protein
MSNSEVDELASMFKQQVPKIFSDSVAAGGGPNVKLYMGRLVCDDCEVNGSYIDTAYLE